ncbi:Esterase protein [Spatholobus suberectus]|nr:Esterase protein [Spatholobus suberectus]
MQIAAAVVRLLEEEGVEIGGGGLHERDKKGVMKLVVWEKGKGKGKGKVGVGDEEEERRVDEKGKRKVGVGHEEEWWRVDEEGQRRVDARPYAKVVWDGGHCTEEANKFIFNQISTGAFFDPPLPLNMACHKL